MKNTVIPEPLLEFRYGQSVIDPHDGLSFFGPYDTDTAYHPSNVSYGLIGTKGGIRYFQDWSGILASSIYTESDLNPRIWPTFPGFETAFSCTWPNEGTRTYILDEKTISDSANEGDPFKRVNRIVNNYMDGIENICKSDDPIDIIICIVPDMVYKNCRPQSKVYDSVTYRPHQATIDKRKGGQLDIFDKYDPIIYQYSVDFRRQIKARAMQFDKPIQIILESTINLEPDLNAERRGLTPLSDRAWNLGVALYYKTGGKPWRISSAREGVCYIGIAYRLKDPGKRQSRSACCAAQMFLDTGDGIVFMGDYGQWYSPKDRVFHLGRASARRLLEGVLKLYKDLEGKPLKEVFLHCRSGIDENEFEGFSEACPDNIKLMGIRVRQDINGIRLYREGKFPVIRGTFWEINPSSGYLWTTGFKSRLGTYDGWEVPVPLKIDIQHGDADIKQVATDILGLTKLNYNACRIGEASPVTIGFSDAVGEILVSNPIVRQHSPKFKFYI